MCWLYQNNIQITLRGVHNWVCHLKIFEVIHDRLLSGLIGNIRNTRGCIFKSRCDKAKVLSNIWHFNGSHDDCNLLRSENSCIGEWIKLELLSIIASRYISCFSAGVDFKIVRAAVVVNRRLKCHSVVDRILWVAQCRVARKRLHRGHFGCNYYCFEAGVKHADNKECLESRIVRWSRIRNVIQNGQAKIHGVVVGDQSVRGGCNFEVNCWRVDRVCKCEIRNRLETIGWVAIAYASRGKYDRT